jgi:tetratricopeptide (TPR) repeat protein
MGQYDEALQYFDQALSLDATDKYTLNNKGFARYQMGNFEQAIEWYDKALEQDKTFVKALTNKGVALADAGKLEESIPFFDQALDLDANDETTLYNKATVLSDLGYAASLANEENTYGAEAISLFDALLAEDSNFETYTYKAMTQYDTQLYEDALITVEEALSLSPDHEHARWYKGKILAALEDEDAAIQAYTKVLEINPAHEYAAQELAELQVEE